MFSKELRQFQVWSVYRSLVLDALGRLMRVVSCHGGSAVHVQMIHQGQGGGNRVAVRCPHCGQNGTFEPLPNVVDVKVPSHWLGIRKCPNPTCNGPLLIIANDAFVLEKSYPALRVDFDPAGIPDRIKRTFVEAVTCHAEA